MQKLDKVEKNIIKKIIKVDNFFKIPAVQNLVLNFNVVNQEEPFKKELIEREQLLKDLETNPEKEKILKAFIGTQREWNKFIFKSFTGYDEHQIINPDLLFKNNNKTNQNNNKIYQNIYFTSKTEKSNKSKTYQSQKKNIKEHQKSTIFYIFNYILFSYKHLKKGGSILFLMSIPDIYLINTFYLLTLLFEEVYVINKFIIFCKSFKNDITQKENIDLIIKNNYIFNIEKKDKEKKFIKYLKNLSKIDYYFKKKAVYNNKILEYINYKFYRDLYIITTINPSYSNEFKIFLKKIYFDYHRNLNMLNLNNNNNNKYNNNFYINEINKFSNIIQHIKEKKK